MGVLSRNEMLKDSEGEKYYQENKVLKWRFLIILLRGERGYYQKTKC